MYINFYCPYQRLVADVLFILYMFFIVKVRIVNFSTFYDNIS